MMKEELKFVLSSFKKAKSLGLDALTIEFYLGFYDLLENILLSIVEELRQLEKVLGAINTTL
jgi:hypothetical protein